MLNRQSQADLREAAEVNVKFHQELRGKYGRHGNLAALASPMAAAVAAPIQPSEETCENEQK